MKVLVAPLDWGLGHATRCVPLIRALRAAGHDVIPCASGAGLRLLRAEFPDLEARALPSYAMRYTRHRALLPLWLLLQLPLFLLSIWRDGRAAVRIARETGAGLIISDGRYGFRSGRNPTVFVSHQLAIIPPGPRALRALLAPALRALNRRALGGFAEIWVPDFPGTPNLSGSLGHPPGFEGARGPRVRFIYPLCRFRPDALPWDRAFSRPGGPNGTTDPVIDTLALLSGPEPQRSLLEAILIRALADLPGTRVIVRGLPGAAGPQNSPRERRPFEILSNGLTIFDHLPQERLLSCLEGARSVVCRSGYTTMMELAGLGKGGVLLVPTPGQPEQEYLAMDAQASGFAAWQDQDDLNVNAGLAKARALPGFGSLFAAGVGGGSGPARAFDLAAWIRVHPLLQDAVSL
jgi:UDP:flavonoid glycosyltransferase YjiC (YdhE family)